VCALPVLEVLCEIEETDLLELVEEYRVARSRMPV